MNNSFEEIGVESGVTNKKLIVGKIRLKVNVEDTGLETSFRKRASILLFTILLVFSSCSRFVNIDRGRSDEHWENESFNEDVQCFGERIGDVRSLEDVQDLVDVRNLEDKWGLEDVVNSIEQALYLEGD